MTTRGARAAGPAGRGARRQGAYEAARGRRREERAAATARDARRGRRAARRDPTRGPAARARVVAGVCGDDALDARPAAACEGSTSSSTTRAAGGGRLNPIVYGLSPGGRSPRAGMAKHGRKRAARCCRRRRADARALSAPPRRRSRTRRRGAAPSGVDDPERAVPAPAGTSSARALRRRGQRSTCSRARRTSSRPQEPRGRPRRRADAQGRALRVAAHARWTTSRTATRTWRSSSAAGDADEPRPLPLRST